MDKILISIIAAVIGATIGFAITFVFNILPEKWLQDYDYDPKSPDFRLSKRMKVFPHGMITTFMGSATYFIAAYFSYEYLFQPFKPLHIIIIALTMPVVAIVVFSDRLNRIIPDQCSIALLILGVVSLFSDYFEDSIWFSQYASWYAPIVNKLVAALVGFGGLWLIGFIGESLLGKESMGQGDMKLLGACGLLVGCYGLAMLIYITAITSLFVSIPLLIKKRIRIANEEKMIKESKDPVAARRELRKKKAQTHFADNPDYVAFGPFLATSAAIFLILEPYFFDMIYGYLMTFGWYF